MNIIITGAGKGIGYETARKLAETGKHKIIAVSRNIKALKTEAHPDIIPYELDLSKSYASKTLAELARKRFPAVDILINNAGVLINTPFLQTTEADFDTQFNINVRAPFFIIQQLHPLLKKGSHIVNISSMGGFQGSVKYPGLSAYSASKAALTQLTECLAAEFQNDGISVNCLALGSVQTEMLEKAFPEYRAPLNASQIADFIAYFSLNGNRFFNGKVIPVALQNP